MLLSFLYNIYLLYRIDIYNILTLLYLGVDAMRRPFIKIREELEDHPSEWLDNDLDDDGVDLNEWAFWQGFYEDA